MQILSAERFDKGLADTRRMLAVSIHALHIHAIAVIPPGAPFFVASSAVMLRPGHSQWFVDFSSSCVGVHRPPLSLSSPQRSCILASSMARYICVILFICTSIVQLHVKSSPSLRIYMCLFLCTPPLRILLSWQAKYTSRLVSFAPSPVVFRLPHRCPDVCLQWPPH